MGVNSRGLHYPRFFTAPLPDPRRSAPLALVACCCGRTYTITAEEAQRKGAAGVAMCPDADCGKGDE